MLSPILPLHSHSPQMHDRLPPGIALVQADNLETWLMDIRVLDDNPIYRGQTYRLKFVFSGRMGESMNEGYEGDDGPSGAPSTGVSCAPPLKPRS